MRSTLVGDAPLSQREREPPIWRRSWRAGISGGAAQEWLIGVWFGRASLFPDWPSQPRASAPESTARGLRTGEAVENLSDLDEQPGAEVFQCPGALVAPYSDWVESGDKHRASGAGKDLERRQDDSHHTRWSMRSTGRANTHREQA